MTLEERTKRLIGELQFAVLALQAKCDSQQQEIEALKVALAEKAP